MRTACWVGVVVTAMFVAAWAGRGDALRAAPGEAAPAKAAGAGAPPPGDGCFVYLRGDASGVAFADRVPSMSNMARLSGTVVADDGEWLVLQDGDSIYRIPHSSILAVHSERAKTGAGKAP